jgi:hypothetical protein
MSRLRYVAAAAMLVMAGGQIQAQARIVGHYTELTEDAATLVLELTSGDEVTIALAEGEVRINDVLVGRYAAGSALDQSWRTLLQEHGRAGPAELVAQIRALSQSGLSPDQVDALAAIRTALGQLEPVPAPTLATGQAAQVAADQTAPVDQAGQVPAVPVPDVPAIPEFRQVRVIEPESGISTSIVGGILSGLASLGASLVALTLMGFGFLFFAPRQLSAISDVAWHSFGRSFLAGLFAQPLVFPVFGMLIVGLVLTVVGILLVPVAIPAFLVALFLAVTGGYIAMARTVGEIYLRVRRKGVPAQDGWAEIKYIAVGLAGLLAIWLPAVFFGRVPMVGPIATVLAAIITWIVATAGFGATILTRGGLKGTVVRRLDRALSEESPWTSGRLSGAGPRVSAS